MFKYALYGIGTLIVLLLVFRLGMVVGARKAGFAYRWSENYHRNFAGPREGFFSEFGELDRIESHGTFGKIIDIKLPALVIDGENNAERAVVLGDDTVIRRFREIISPHDLKTGDAVVVIGSPNDAGQIEARLIRVMPGLPVHAATSSSTSLVPDAAVSPR